MITGSRIDREPSQSSRSRVSHLSINMLRSLLLAALLSSNVMGFRPLQTRLAGRFLSSSFLRRTTGRAASGRADEVISVRIPKPMGLVFEENDPSIGGLFVDEIAADSAAERNGTIEVGDQLIEVGGVDVSKVDFDAAMDVLVAANEEGVDLKFTRTVAPGNPKVFFDITIGGEPAGRIEMTLRADVVPETAEK